MKVLRAEQWVQASPEQVFEAFTTNAGVRRFFAPEASVSSVPGAPYELYFMMDAPEGQRGSEGCVVLEAEAPGHLAVSWNFPPSLPGLRQAEARTRIDLRVTATEPGSLVCVEQSGWQEGEEWALGYAYFERAWALVLERLAASFVSGPVDWKQP